MRSLFRRLPALLLAGSLSLAAAAAQELFSLVNTPFGMDRWVVRRYDANTGASLGQFGSLAGVSFAGDIAFGPAGDLFVCDLGGNRVLRLDGQTGTTVGAIGSFPNLLSPRCILFGPDESLLVSSHTRIQRYDARTGAFLGQFGQGQGFASDMVWGPDGNIYCTTSSGTVERFGPSGAWLGQFVTAAFADGGLSTGNGLTFGPDGNLYCASSGSGDIRRFDGRTGAPLGVFAANGFFTNPEDLLFGPDGNLYVGDRDAIKVYDGRTGSHLRNLVQTGDFFERNSRLAMRPMIPEPSVAAMLLAAAPVLLLRRRRR